MNTKSGKSPVQDEFKFTISTDDVRRYLQDSFRKKNLNFQLNLQSLKLSDSFQPFLLIMDSNVLENPNKKGSSEASIFNREDDSEENNGIRLKRDAFSIIGAYTFNKNDELIWNHPSFKKDHNISQKACQMLRQARRPYMHKIPVEGKGVQKYVAVLLDPIRVFFDMVSDVDHPNTQYDVKVGVRRTVGAGLVEYNVLRTPREKAAQFTGNIDAIIAKSIADKFRP